MNRLADVPAAQRAAALVGMRESAIRTASVARINNMVEAAPSDTSPRSVPLRKCGQELTAASPGSKPMKQAAIVIDRLAPKFSCKINAARCKEQ
jgi:hypothetical protein